MAHVKEAVHTSLPDAGLTDAMQSFQYLMPLGVILDASIDDRLEVIDCRLEELILDDSALNGFASKEEQWPRKNRRGTTC